MGAVKSDIYKKEYEFKNISFSDVDTLKGLIKSRYELDPYIDIRTNNNIYEAGEVNPINQEIICLFVDLDNLIKNTILSEKQRNIVRLYMNGFETEQIAEHYKQKHNQISEILDTVCSKLKKTNDEQWKYDYIYLNYKKVKWDYKLCSKCNKSKPRTSEFFSPNSYSNDGFRNICRECR